MASVRLGKGEQYEDASLLARVPHSRLVERDTVTIRCSTPNGDEQKNFPVTMVLDRSEALQLVESIVAAIAPEKRKRRAADTIAPPKVVNLAVGKSVLRRPGQK